MYGKTGRVYIKSSSKSYHKLIRSLTHSLPRSLTHSLSQSINQLINQSLIHSGVAPRNSKRLGSFAYDFSLLLGRHLKLINDKDVQIMFIESSLILINKTECKYNNIR